MDQSFRAGHSLMILLRLVQETGNVISKVLQEAQNSDCQRIQWILKAFGIHRYTQEYNRKNGKEHWHGVITVLKSGRSKTRPKMGSLRRNDRAVGTNPANSSQNP